MSDFDYKNYWNDRYNKGGNSGAGSYGDNAVFKADFINKFIELRKLKTVVEFGCGDGNNLELYKIPEYLGVDVSQEAIARCQNMFRFDEDKAFNIMDINREYKADLTLALDVTYHIFPREEWELFINKVIDSAEKYALFYSFLKPNGQVPHINDYNFKEYIEKYCKEKGFEYEIVDKVPPNSQSRFVIIKK